MWSRRTWLQHGVRNVFTEVAQGEWNGATELGGGVERSQLGGREAGQRAEMSNVILKGRLGTGQVAREKGSEEKTSVLGAPSQTLGELLPLFWVKQDEHPVVYVSGLPF